MESETPELLALKRRLEEEEAAYASVLAVIDRLATFKLPAESLPELPAQREALNALWRAEPPPAGLVRSRVWSAMARVVGRQEQFNATLVQLLNGWLDETAGLGVRFRELVTALVGYLQRVLPLVDARDRMATALGTTRAELVLEAFDRRLESLGRRIEGLSALRDRLETLSEQLRAVEGVLAAAAPPPAVAAAAARASEDALYAAFENTFRSPDVVRDRLAPYVECFRGQSPVVDLGCGRGEFLTLLKEAGIQARGVEMNARTVRECRERGLDVVQGDLVSFLAGEAGGSLGGVFGAQVAEHLPPAVLQRMLTEAWRALRAGGLLVLETINPCSLVAFLEIYNRDLTHERPLHPDTLRFLAAAAGFTDVRVELRTPVEPLARLQAVPTEGLPEPAGRILNENLTRLNALLYGPQEYALVARR